MLEVRAPSINMPSSKQGFSDELLFVNGGASIRRSTAAHKRYTLTWNSVDRDDARVILDLADGLYGSGEIYWHDPFVADRNVLPQQWASPFQGAIDGVALNAGERPQRVTTVENSLNFPVFSARYNVTTPNTKRVWIPIPTGYTAHVGIYGQDVSGGKMLAIPTFEDGSFVEPQELTLLSLSDDSRFNYQVSSSSGYNGMFLRLGGSGILTIAGMMVQVLPNGVSPETGGFISGQGHSGLSFATQPNYTPYSAVYTKAALAAQFVETGAWR